MNCREDAMQLKINRFGVAVVVAVVVARDVFVVAVTHRSHDESVTGAENGGDQDLIVGFDGESEDDEAERGQSGKEGALPHRVAQDGMKGIRDHHHDRRRGQDRRHE